MRADKVMACSKQMLQCTVSDGSTENNNLKGLRKCCGTGLRFCLLEWWQRAREVSSD
jgi:hypothetical protein